MTFSAMVMNPTQNLSATATAGMSVGLTMNKFYTAYTFIESTAAPLVRGKSYTLDAKALAIQLANSYRVLAGPDGDLVVTGQIHAYGYIGSTYNMANLNGTSPLGNLTAASMCRYAQIGTNTRFGDYTVHPARIRPMSRRTRSFRRTLLWISIERCKVRNGAIGSGRES